MQTERQLTNMIRRIREMLQDEGYRPSELDVARGLEASLDGLGRRDCAEVLALWTVLYKDEIDR